MNLAGYPTHPAADRLPMLSEVELAALAEDVRQNGLLVPIVLLDGKVLDGRNRLAACEKAGVKPRFVEHDGTNPFRRVWSLNGRRRDLEAGRKAQLFLAYKEDAEGWDRKHAKKERHEKGNAGRSEKAKAQHAVSNPRRGEKLGGASREAGPDQHATARDLAAEAGVSRATMERAIAIADKAPDLAEQVADGELKQMEALRTAKKREVQAKSAAAPTQKYRVIYADPPWSYGNSQPDYHSEARDHYPTMKLSEICAIPVKEWAEDDAVLFLWTTSPHLEESFDVVRAWGFTYKASFVWDKVAHNMGHYNSVRHEFLLVCTRGACTPDVRKLFDSVITEERTEHSVKPTCVYEIIETLYTHGNRLEMFARRARDGWDAWGLEAPRVSA